jgi:hypothetical protein
VESLLVQVTVVPLVTVKVCGEKANPEIVTDAWLEADVADEVVVAGVREEVSDEIGDELHPATKINAKIVTIAIDNILILIFDSLISHFFTSGIICFQTVPLNYHYISANKLRFTFV